VQAVRGSITQYARRIGLSRPGARARLRKLVGLCPRCGRPRWDGAFGAGCLRCRRNDRRRNFRNPRLSRDEALAQLLMTPRPHGAVAEAARHLCVTPQRVSQLVKAMDGRCKRCGQPADDHLLCRPCADQRNAALRQKREEGYD
jgi:hypothetical protein